MKAQASIVGSTLMLGLLSMTSPGARADGGQQEKLIRALDEQWVAAAQRKDAAATAAFYAEDGAILPANAPLAKGRAAVAEVWAGLFKLPSLDIHFAPTEVTVSKGEDLAYEVGTYTLSFQDKAGPVKDVGKYVVVWKQVGGNWKAAADIFNSDQAMK